VAWEQFDRRGRKGMSGDKPIDEMSLALRRIAVAYEERYERKPSLDEIMHALDVVLRSSPADYVCDPESLK